MRKKDLLQENSATLGRFSLSMIVIGLVIGLGIFRTARDVAGAALTPAIFFAAWVAGGLLTICGGLVFAEIGSRYPVTGGYYTIFSKAYHPSIAFAINGIILLSNAATLSGVALIGSEYLMAVAGTHSGSSVWIAGASILLFYGVNLLGLRQSSLVQNGLMIVKIAVLLAIIAAVFFKDRIGQTAAATVPATEAGWLAVLISFGAALKGACFTYGGYQQTINFGGEVRDPVRSIPRAIVSGMLVVMGLYLLVNWSYYELIGFEALRKSSAIASIIAGRFLGATGEWIAAVVLFLAVLAYVNVSLLSNPRVLSAMSGDRLLPAAFGKREERTGVFRLSLTVFAAMALLILCFFDSFSNILSFTIFLDCLGMMTAGISLFIFRKRKSQSGKAVFKIRWYPLVPLLFITGYGFVAVSIAVETPQYALTGVLTLLFFLLIYAGIYLRQKP